MISIETSYLILKLIDNIGLCQEEVNQYRYNLINNNLLLLDFRKIFNSFTSNNIYAKNIINYMLKNESINYLNFTEEDIVDLIYINTHKDYFDIYNFYKFLTGDNIENPKHEWLRDYTLEKIQQKFPITDISYELEITISNLLLHEIALIQSIKREVVYIIKRKDFNIDNIFKELCDNKNINFKFNLITFQSISNFCKKCKKNIIDQNIINFIIKFGDNNYIDYNSFFNVFINHNNNKEKNDNTKIAEISLNKDNITKKFNSYLKDVLKAEKEIENLKINFINDNPHFSIEKLFSIFTINNEEIPFSNILTNFMKIGIILKQKEVILLNNRVDHFYKLNNNLTRFKKLIFPYYYKNNSNTNEKSINKYTLNKLIELILFIVSKETRLNDLRKILNLSTENIELIYQSIIANNKVGKINYSIFIKYLIINGIQFETNSEAELLFERFDKTHSESISIYDITKELSFI